ncbi:MAG: PD40 domain-containing protein [Deltaproteobacteria bacterium]|nr:PD40 domain-containing protein [Deltaproteobacteria bacterium]
MSDDENETEVPDEMPPSSALSLSVTGMGTGTLRDEFGTEQCRSEASPCSVSGIEGSAYALMAVADAGFLFNTWIDCPQPLGNVCTGNFLAGAHVGASFTPLVFADVSTDDIEPATLEIELFSIRTDGSDIRRLTNMNGLANRAVASVPAWSPDGEKIAFGITLTPSAASPAVTTTRLAWINAKTVALPAVPTTLVEPAASSSVLSLAWGHNGKSIFHTVETALDINVSESQFDASTKLLQPSGNGIYHWARLSSRRMAKDVLLLSNHAFEGDGILATNFWNLWDVGTGLPITRLTDHAGSAFALSPDGNTVYIRSDRTADGAATATVQNIFSVSRSSGEVVPITTWAQGTIHSLALSPDGTKIALGARLALAPGEPLPTAGNLWIMNVDGTNLVAVTAMRNATVGFTRLKWDPSGKAIFATSGRALSGADSAAPSSNIWRYDVSTGAATPLTDAVDASRSIVEFD